MNLCFPCFLSSYIDYQTHASSTITFASLTLWISGSRSRKAIRRCWIIQGTDDTSSLGNDEMQLCDVHGVLGEKSCSFDEILIKSLREHNKLIRHTKIIVKYIFKKQKLKIEIMSQIKMT
ncbi:uncharacterized protein LOC143182984 [Calliopsis andreniformis]|uniref:uncharacterized protein LOC143182984 n=1 Tax=Calliopsis andreniformis TaxID=337506 RepID=UPI003FCE7D89